MHLIESDVRANGINLHVYRTHSGKPPLLLSHGRSDNGLCYWPFAQQFANEYEIILYDSRNHGQSDGTEANTLVDRANDLAELIQALGLPKPALIGHSLGAVTIALLAGLHPQMPGCIVLEDPPPLEMMTGDNPQLREFHNHWLQLATENKQKSLDELIAMSRTENPTWPEAERAPWALSKQQFNLNAFTEGSIDLEEGRQLYAQITCPTLLVTADSQRGAMFPTQAADALVAQLPNAMHVNIPGAGHNIRREQPTAFATAVRNFLATQA